MILVYVCTVLQPIICVQSRQITHVLLLSAASLKLITSNISILTKLLMKSTIFCDVMPCIPLNIHRRFGRTHYLQLLYRILQNLKSKIRQFNRGQNSFHDETSVVQNCADWSTTML
jgi:hypothetical protein